MTRGLGAERRNYRWLLRWRQTSATMSSLSGGGLAMKTKSWETGDMSGEALHRDPKMGRAGP